MNAECWKLSQSFIPESYARQACEVSKSRENLIRQLLHHKKVPDDGFDDLTIEMLLLQLSAMDSNNFPSNCGVGEREGRFASELVAKRHYRFSHGIGRSGDLSEPQPKAAGSSLMYNLTNVLLQDLIRQMGIQSSVECLLVPVATGMAVVLSLLSLRVKRPHAKYVIWSRIDQKSCFKSILTAGFIPVIVNTLQVGNGCHSNVELLEDKIKELGSDNVLCVFSTTSCFAPRISDDIETIAKFCKVHNVPHLINNAYGLQSELLMKKIQRAFNKGRVDIFIQSTDKNLMVPVGGAIIASFNKTTLQNVAKLYPGRASSSPLIDCFITILSLGKNGYKKLVDERVEMFDYLRQELEVVATTFKEKVLHSSLNPISIGLTLTNIPKNQLTKVGSMLFWRNVSGTRVVTTVEEKTIESNHFQGWGCHSNGFSEPYLTAAASLGLKKADIDLFIKRLTKVLLQLINKKDSKGVYNENTSQTNECSPFEVSTSTSTTSEIQTQTDEQDVKTEASDVDMQKLADWLAKIYPNVNKELNESVNSKAFYGGYSFQQPDLIAEAKLLQTLNVVSKSREKDLAFRVNALSWNSTGNSLAVSCNHLHKSWCHHSGQVSVYTFNRNDKLPDIPSKSITVSACVTILRFHPSVPSIIAIGSHSGEITIWNIQHDDGDGIVAKVNGHDETVTQMIWMYDINTYKSLLLATSSIDGYLNLWNFNLTSSQLIVKQRYKIKSPVLAKVRSSNTSEELARKVVRGILSFDFSTYVPDLFIVGVEGGLVVQCSMLGVNQLKGSTPELPVSDPVFKYYEPHEGEIQTIRCSPNRRDLFMTSANDGEIRIYVIDQDAPARVIFFEQQLNQVSWVPYQEKLICGCGHKGIIEIFDLINNKQITNITSEKVVPTALLQLEVNKQRCTTVAVGNDKGEIQLWTIPWSSFAVQTAE